MNGIKKEIENKKKQSSKILFWLLLKRFLKKHSIAAAVLRRQISFRSSCLNFLLDLLCLSIA